MEELFLKSLLIVCAYLLGSVPTAVWVGKFFYGIDIRDHGSGNAGATNTFRVLGKKAGIPVFIIDVAKGYMAVRLSFWLVLLNPGTDPFINFQLLLGVAAFIGHLFPVFAGFRGGKGVATLFGVVLALHSFAALISIGIFIIVLLISKYVSLSSIIAGITFPILIIFVFPVTTESLLIFSVLIATLLILTHQKNIGRLLRKEESKVYLIRKDRPINKN
jgi:acyl phosphate:glycerol-3-phosphate acyltransferase